MPTVTIAPASAAGLAVAIAARKPAASGMTWSAGETIITASGSRSASHRAAASTAGAVLRARGSISVAAAASEICANCSLTTKRKGSPVTTMGARSPRLTGGEPTPERGSPRRSAARTASGTTSARWPQPGAQAAVEKHGMDHWSIPILMTWRGCLPRMGDLVHSGSARIGSGAAESMSGDVTGEWKKWPTSSLVAVISMPALQFSPAPNAPGTRSSSFIPEGPAGPRRNN